MLSDAEKLAIAVEALERSLLMEVIFTGEDGVRHTRYVRRADARAQAAERALKEIQEEG